MEEHFKYGLINFGIKKNDKIMMPEYICDVLLDPLKKLGVKPIFYRIKDNFTLTGIVLKRIIEIQ